MAGSSTRITEKGRTFTRGLPSSGNCLKVFPERTACSSMCSAPRGQSKPTGHIAAGFESPCYSLLPEELHANEEIFCNSSRRPHFAGIASVSPCRLALPDMCDASRSAEGKEEKEGQRSEEGHFEYAHSSAG